MVLNLQSLSCRHQRHPDTRRQRLPSAGGHAWKGWKGAKLVVAGRHEEADQKFATELRKLGAEAEFIRADVRKENDVSALVDETLARFGRLDIAVNNASCREDTITAMMYAWPIGPTNPALHETTKRNAA